MASTSSRSRAWMLTMLLTSVALVACGGGEDAGSEFPPLMGSYGATPIEPGKFDQYYTMSDGETEYFWCSGYVDVADQQGGAWTGSLIRGQRRPGGRCDHKGTIVGQVDQDGVLTFTVTQEGWSRDCRSTGPGHYTGQLHRNRFYAEGTTPIVCEDGRQGTVREVVSATFPAPEGTHDT